MAGQITVNPAELVAASNALAQQAETTTSLAARLETIQLTRGDFGYIPGMGDKCWDAYSQHVSTCHTALTQMSSSLSTLSETTRVSAESYQQTEQQNLSYLQQLSSMLSDTEGGAQ